jgi:hypothetical protein
MVFPEPRGGDEGIIRVGIDARGGDGGGTGGGALGRDALRAPSCDGEHGGTFERGML